MFRGPGLSHKCLVTDLFHIRLWKLDLFDPADRLEPKQFFVNLLISKQFVRTDIFQNGYCGLAYSKMVSVNGRILKLVFVI